MSNDFNSRAKAHFAPKYATAKRIPLSEVVCLPLMWDSFSKAEPPQADPILYPVFGQNYTTITCGHLRERTLEEMRIDFCGVSQNCIYDNSDLGYKEAVQAIRKVHCYGDIRGALEPSPTSGAEVNESDRNLLRGMTSRDRPVYPSRRVDRPRRASRQ
jgi:hypothetical protein